MIATVEGRLVAVADTELFLAELGTGLPVIALHGGLGLDHTYLRPWLDPLGDTARVVYCDLRGNGRSPAGRPLADVDLATWADDVEGIRRHLGVDRAVVFGHSYGGFVALEYALRHPERVAGLVLCGTAAAFDHWDAIRAELDARGASPRQRWAFEGGEFGSDEEFGGWLREAAPLYASPAAPPDLLRFDDVRFRVDALQRGSACVATWDRRPDLNRVTAPALVLNGRHDVVMPLEAAGAPLAAALPAATSVVFERSGHLPFVEEHGAFIRVVRQWLASLGADEAGAGA